MTDLLPEFEQLLSRYNVSLRLQHFQIDSTGDEFLKEAYRINDHIRSLHRYLLSIRRAYLSAAPPQRRLQRSSEGRPNGTASELTYLSNDDKDAVDANSKALLRDLAASLTQLASAESLRRETSAQMLAKRYHKGILSTWAAGAGAAVKGPEQLSQEQKLETLRIVRESVLWYLRKHLENAGEVQRKMMERRLEREIEKGRSSLYNATSASSAPHTQEISVPMADTGAMSDGLRTGTPGPKYSTGSTGTWKIEEDAQRETEQQLTPEQLQLFDKENQNMLKQYEDQLDQVRTAERSMYEISELQTQLAYNVDIQSANISQLVTDSLSTAENVGGGNKELKRATERTSRARLVFLATCGLCSFLVVWDLIF